MAIFYHVDVRDEIQAGEILTAMPVKSSTYPTDASDLNAMFPQGVSFFGATVMLHMDPDSPDAVIEQILETIRRKFLEECGVDYPSRMSSVFACADLDSARQFRDDFQRQQGRIWEFECDDFFKGDMSFVCHEMVNNHDLAVHYWQGRQKGEQPFWEYLLRPPVKVIREITECRDNSAAMRTATLLRYPDSVLKSESRGANGETDSSKRKWIKENAYFRWVEEGYEHGHALRHWREAEQAYCDRHDAESNSEHK